MMPAGSDLDPSAVAEVFNRLDPTVWLLTSRAGERRGGLIATFVTPASIVRDMPRVLVGLAKHHYTRSLVEESSTFALHLLRAEQIDLVWLFGLRSGRSVDKLADIPTRDAPSGCPILRDVLGWLDCRVEDSMDIGDRTVYLAEVIAGGVQGVGPALTVARVVDGAPQEKLEALQRSVAEHGAVDARLIREWRGE